MINVFSNNYHEPAEELPESARDIHRAVRSLVEEMEAVDWYDQRLATTTDKQLAKVVKHNRDEELEHAAMSLEWLRREIPELNDALVKYLFTTGDITKGA